MWVPVLDEEREDSDSYACDDGCQIGNKWHLIRKELNKCKPYQPKRDGDDEGKEQRSLEPIIILLRNIVSLCTKRGEVDGTGMI